jgi:hypothetical protein
MGISWESWALMMIFFYIFLWDSPKMGYEWDIGYIYMYIHLGSPNSKGWFSCEMGISPGQLVS